jgi:hypothetical protein
MSDERSPTGGPQLGRWIIIGALILIGIALYFRFAPSSRPVAPPPHQEAE